MNAARAIGVGIADLGRSGQDIHAHLVSQLDGKYAIDATFDGAADRLRESAQRFG